MSLELSDKAQRLYILRSLLAPVVSARWTSFIRNFHQRLGAPRPVARVMLKPIRNYLHRGYWPRARLDVLLRHYSWFREKFSDEFQRRVCANEEIEIVSLRGRKDSTYRIFIAASVVAILQREGELAIYLAKSTNAPKLCRLSLSYVEVDGQSALVIGGIQGPLTSQKRDVIDATRELFGLRPKDAVLLAARAFADALHVPSVHAVSDANHVLRRLQDKSKFSSYDEYWKERGAAPEGPFGFIFGKLDPQEPSSAKRDGMKAEIVDAVTAFVKANLTVEPSPDQSVITRMRLAAAG